MKNFGELEKILGGIFVNQKLLEEALTHRSFLNENNKGETIHNERLEFLGDAVLELAVTEFIFKEYPEKDEGELTSLRSALVNSNMLSEVATGLNLRDFLRVSKGEAKDSGKGKQFILANAVEAVIGATYLDQGYDSVAAFIQKQICSRAEKVLEQKTYLDSKSLFQEKAQDIESITPTYNVISETGPDHLKHFVMGVYLGDELVATGEGYSKQEAQMKAAENALKARGWEQKICT